MAEMDRQRGERIRDLREAHAWTQRQLADRLHVDPKTVHNWEAGKELNPSNLRELADLLSVSMNYIRFGASQMPDVTGMLGKDTQLDRMEAELAAIRVELGAATTLLEDLTRSLAQRTGSGASPKKNQRAK